MKSNADEIKDLILGMRREFAAGNNVMEWARGKLESNQNTPSATLIAYDLQAGSYVKNAKQNMSYQKQWGEQLANVIARYISNSEVNTILEVGVGEATTLVEVEAALPAGISNMLGLDLSWSRLKVAESWAERQGYTPELFVGDLFNAPLSDGSVDIVYTSHSIEPNGGRELQAIAELARIARRFVVLIEPIFELAGKDAQSRMMRHGYVRNLREAGESLGLIVREYGLLDLCQNPENPSGVIVLEKPDQVAIKRSAFGSSPWRCPITHLPMRNVGGSFFVEDAGLVYPVLESIPLLKSDHAIIASLYSTDYKRNI